MRFSLAAAVLCAYSVVAQFEVDEDDFSDDIQARNVRDDVWKAAHGGSKGSTYRGFEEMAHGYPGHPLKGYGARHHARDADDEENEALGDEDGFIDNTVNYANHFARAVKDKANNAVKHAKAKAGYDHDDDDDDDRHFQWGPPGMGQQHGGMGQHHGAGKWPHGQHGAGWGHGGQWKKPSKRDVDEDDDDGEEIDPENDDSGDAEDFTDGEFDDDSDLLDEGSDSLAERDVDDEVDSDDDESSPLAERDLEDDESAPADVAFNDDEEDLPDPKLQMEEEFDEGLDEGDDEGGLFERDAEAEPLNWFGWGGKDDDHKAAKHGGHEAWKKGMKHLHARDGGVLPEEDENEDDDDLDGAYDPAAEDPNISDEDFYAAAYDGDLDAGLDKRSAPHMIGNSWGSRGGYGSWDDDDDDDDDHTTKKHTRTATRTGTKTGTGKGPTRTRTGTSHTKTGTGKDHTKTGTGKDHTKTGSKAHTQTGTKHTKDKDHASTTGSHTSKAKLHTSTTHRGDKETTKKTTVKETTKSMPRKTNEPEATGNNGQGWWGLW